MSARLARRRLDSSSNRVPLAPIPLVMDDLRRNRERPRFEDLPRCIRGAVVDEDDLRHLRPTLDGVEHMLERPLLVVHGDEDRQASCGRRRVGHSVAQAKRRTSLVGHAAASHRALRDTDEPHSGNERVDECRQGEAEHECHRPRAAAVRRSRRPLFVTCGEHHVTTRWTIAHPNVCGARFGKRNCTQNASSAAPMPSAIANDPELMETPSWSKLGAPIGQRLVRLEGYW